jgi:hypothetical protein
MATTAETGNVAERLVARWLAEHGYTAKIDTTAPESTEIEASGNAKSLLVQVKSAEQPSTPDTLTSEEMRNITMRAAQLGFEAWEARVQLDQQLRQVGDIRWRKLTQVD